MTKIIHLIRHGESKANALGVYQGQSFNTSLSSKGKKQAEIVAKILKRAELKAKSIYTSPLKRAFQTALVINNHLGLEIVEDKRLMEISHGDWEGKTVREFNKREQKRLKSWQDNPSGVKMPNGETIIKVMERCNLFMNSLPDGRYIVVAHDLVIRVIASMALRQDFSYLWKYHLDNCGVTTVSLDPFRLVSLNQNFHLNGFRSKLNRQAM